MKTAFWIAFTLIVGYGLWVQEIKPRMEAAQGEGVEQSIVEEVAEVKKADAKQSSGPTKKEELAASASKKAEEKKAKEAASRAARSESLKAAAAERKEKYAAAREASIKAEQERKAKWERENTAFAAKKAKIRALQDKISATHKKLRDQEYEWASSKIKLSKTEKDKVRNQVEDYVAKLNRELAAIK